MSELRKNIYAATKELPVEVQAKGKTLFYITESTEEVVQPTATEKHRDDHVREIVRVLLEEMELRKDFMKVELGTTPQKNTKEMGTMPVDNIPSISTIPIEKKPISIPGVMSANKLKVDPAIGFCELHYDTQGPHKRTMCTWDDENGTPLVDKKWICDDCVTKYENMGRGHLYFL